MSAHDFVEVQNRRWCVRCDLFQTKGDGAAFFPTPRKPCPQIYNPNKKRFSDILSDEAVIDNYQTITPPTE